MKKGSLSLAINAIVVLILAITMLGLGLTFMRKTFGGVTEQFEEVSEQMESQIIDEIRASNERVAFNRIDIDIQKAKEKTMFYGIKNDLNDPATDPEFFHILTYCDSDLETDTADYKDEFVSFKTFTKREIKQGDIDVLKLIVGVVSSATSNTHNCYMDVCEGMECDPDQDPYTPYARKNFFVTVP